MDWFAFSIAGAACLAVTGIIDKFYLGRYVRNTLAYLFVLVVIQQVFLLPVLAYAGLEFVYPQSLYALSIGVVQVILWAAYLRALKVEETSRIAGQVYVFPVFVFLGEFFLLGETLRPSDYVGGALLVLAALLISYHPASHPGRIAGGGRISPALKYMAVFWVLTAATLWPLPARLHDRVASDRLVVARQSDSGLSLPGQRRGSKRGGGLFPVRSEADLDSFFE